MSNFQCRPRDAGSMGILENTKNQYDELNNRFSDLLVRSKPSFLSEDTTTDDSDSLFQSIKSCKNVTFARSRSYFDDEVQLFPLTPSIATDKHLLLTSDEEEDNQVIHDKQLSRHKQNRSSNFYSVPRSPLKACSANSLTPIQTGKSAKRNISHILSFRSQPDLLSPISKPDISILSVDKPCSSRDKENLIATNTIILSPHSSHSGTSDASTVQNSLSRPMDKTPLNKSNKKISKTSTPLNKALTPNLGFKTPVSSSTTVKSRMSIEKRNSIDRAVSSAKQFIKSIPEFNKKEGNTPVLKRKCDSPATSIGLARNSLFRTPTPAGSDKPYSTGNSVTPLTGNARPSSNSRPALTGVKNLENQNNDKTPVSKCAGVKLNSNSNGNKDKSLGQIGLSDEDNDDLPCTQPVTAILLRNVVAYVEVRCGRDYLSEGTKSELESLGARVEKNFTRKVTHCFFHGGRMSTYRKAVEWKVPLVSTLWIEACKAELDVVPLKGYEPPGLEKYKEALPLYRLKTKGLRRAVTDSKIRRKPWKEDELNKNVTQAVSKRLIPPVPTFKETDKIIDALHSVAGDLRKATNQFEKILTSPVLLKKGEENPKNCNGSKHDQPRSSSNCQRKRNKKLVFGSSSDDDNKNKKIPTNSETAETSSKISDINDSEVRVSYDSDDLLVYAKKQAANTRSSAPPRLLTSRKCKKLLSSCKETEKKNNEEGANKREDINKNNEITNVRITRRSRLQPTEAEKDCSSKNLTQTKKRKLLLPSQVIANFEQDSGESTPPASPKCPYKPTPPNKKLRTGVAVKSKTVRTLADVKVMSDCDSDDSLTRAARRESSALFVKKDKKVIHQKTNPTIVCTSLSRSDEEVVKSIVAQLGTFTVEAAVSERTTHVVTPLPRRTINLLKGIARGCWVLDVQWVYKSLEAGQWVSEERYELTKFSPAVKVARSDRQAFGPEFGLELFAGLGPFYVCRATVPPSRDLAELLRLGGGVVVSNARAAKVVIGSTPPLSPCGRTLPLMVKEKWVLDCITRLTQLSFTDYIAIPDSEP